MSKPDGGPAFPSHGTMGEVVQQGMSLRAYFAAAALQGICAAHHNAAANSEVVAEDAVFLADALIAELERDK